MDRDFMTQYYINTYENEGVDMAKKAKDKEYLESLERQRELDKKLRERCGENNSELWKLHEECMAELAGRGDIRCLESYLQGALDREKMLR